MSFEVALEQLNYGRVPRSDQDWTLCDEEGWTIAHACAIKGLLPVNYSDWLIADNKGWSVGHAAATVSVLKDSFPHWFLEDHSGVTVAEVALLNGNIPKDFPLKYWKVKLRQGKTLAHIAAENGCIPQELFQFNEIMKMKDGEGVSVEEIQKKRSSNKLKECIALLRS